MEQWLHDMPKVDSHVHIEGAVSPDMVRGKAGEHKLALPDGLFTADGQGYVYDGFVDLVTRVYDAVAATIRTKQDFADAAYDHMKRGAADNCIFTKFIVSPDHCERLGLAYADMLAGMTKGIDAARKDFDVEARMRATLVRHLSDKEVMRAARLIIDNPHPYVREIDLAGAEVEGDMARFLPVIRMILREAAGRIKTIGPHAAEVGGPGNLRIALTLPKGKMKNVGHGVLVMNDPALVEACARRGTVFEVSQTSNVLAGVFKDHATHNLPLILAAGLAVTLATDDPGLFGPCTIGGEYEIAHTVHKVEPAGLLNFSRNGVRISGLQGPDLHRYMRRVNTHRFPEGAGL